MKKVEVTKTMYETIDGRRFETQAEAVNHEMNLENHKDIILFAMRIKGMCNKYATEGYEECNPMCPFKKKHNCCVLEDFPCDWELPPLNNNPSY